MNKRDYFVRVMNSDTYKKKRWIISAFSIVREGPKDFVENPYPNRIVRKDDAYYFIDPNKQGDHTMIEGAGVSEPVFRFKDSLKLKAGELVNLKEDVTTTYGQALVNQLALVYAFHDKVPYQNGEIKAKSLEKLIEPRLTNEPEGGAPLPGDDDYVGGEKAPIYISEYKRFAEAMFSLAGYTQLCVPAATPKSMVTHPDMAELKKRLLEKYKDRLHDPAAIAEIEKELIALDREWLKGDPSEGFYIGGSSISVKRKRMHLMYGAEMGFADGDKADLIANSLSEGWEIDKIPGMMNSLREGSYSRGKLTALGGESVKYFMRVFQNTKIVEEDCGSTLGRQKNITEDNHRRYLGFYKINPSGLERLTEDNIQKYIGKSITIRSPMFCRSEGTGFCSRCVGDVNAENPKGLGAAVAEVGSEFMSIFMAAAHARQLKTVPWSIGELT